MTIPLYYRYWGKADEPLKEAYCSGRDKEAIVVEFKKKIASRLKKPENEVELADLEAIARMEKWQYRQKNYIPYHLLVFHCVDVAAVGAVLLERHPYLRKQFSELFGLPENIVCPWILTLLALHDGGKFAESFQQLKADIRRSWWGEITRTHYDMRHDSLGFVLWDDKNGIRNYLQAGVAEDSDIYLFILKYWLQAVAGHHGLPPKSSKSGGNITVNTYFRGFDLENAAEFYNAVELLFRPDIDAIIEYLDDDDWLERQQPACWLLAGFAVLCDWLGSDASIFQYCNDETLTLSDYWENRAIPLAEKAVCKAGILPAHRSSGSPLSALFSYITSPTPLQKQSESIVIDRKPQLFILEDVTGAGKTEAALMLTHRLMAEGLAEGVFVALPTMATANAMYGRMAECYLNLYAQGEKPSLVLAHSARHLSERFQQSIIAYRNRDFSYAASDKTASAQCSRWLSDHRKKALLADVGIGTVDQALLGIVPARHQSLRLLGLCNKVLIVDEVHAYDAYMNGLLKTLLQFHAFMGGSAILMSATLPQKMRRELVKAFQQGANYPIQGLQKTGLSDYPLMTHARSDEVVERCLDTRPEVKRRAHVELLHDIKVVHNVIETALLSNQCVCWVRNTVFDARSAYAEMQNVDWIENDKLLLFHSRFTLQDRKTVEDQVLSFFDKNSVAEQRRGKLVIATQVVEQSLDLDFDIMISDLAPIDLLIQRAGRLHRHVRDGLGNPLERSEQDGSHRNPPVLYVYSPSTESAPTENWFKDYFPKANGIYPHTGQLWRTATLLADKRSWRMPEDARELIETVYREDDDDIPPALVKASNDAEGEHWSKVSMANMNALKLKQGYSLSDQAWDEDDHIPTRLSDDSLTLYLAVWNNGVLEPYAHAERYCWDLSAVNVNAKSIKGLPELPRELSTALIQLKEQERIFNEYSFILPLSQQSEREWIGQALDKQENKIDILYSNKLGLLLGEEVRLFNTEKTA